jgi:ribosomal-protein-alanine N-acetyltransferase
MSGFETERLIVRRPRPDDKDNFFLLNGDENVMRYIRAVITKEESDAKLDQFLADDVANTLSKGKGRWLIDEKATGNFIGSFAIIPIPGEPEKTQLGYSFIPAAWGRGYATEVAKAGLQFFLETTDIPEIYGISETANTASMKVLEKAGFVFHSTKMEEGKELTVFIVRREV